MMVMGMSIYNLLLVGHFSWEHVIKGYIPALAVAFIIDFFIVGMISQKIASLFLQEHHKQWQKIVTISGMMTLGMVTAMSFYGLVVNHIPISYSTYTATWLANVAMAIPLNFLVVGPISRFILGHIQNKFDDDNEITEDSIPLSATA